MTAITLIDNYDSFTWNLVHCLGRLGAAVTVHRNDCVSVAEVMGMAPDAIVLSPGPCRPCDAGILLDLIAAAADSIPIFGVCLGHQALGEAFGGEVVRAPKPVHGKLARIEHCGESVFRGIDSPFWGVRYHSLVVQGNSLPDGLAVTATADGLVMGLSHKRFPAHGVQFHPESIASEHGLQVFENFLELAADWNGNSRRARTSPPALSRV
ncbi:MAG: aminodeoxychorismate/anthranilate synthase component II [Beijerinckiaceae bacterium]|nr:aminodeoxychorismate/anthranilate synthase component II [Beijerinckiaceae bacterium]